MHRRLYALLHLSIGIAVFFHPNVWMMNYIYSQIERLPIVVYRRCDIMVRLCLREWATVPIGNSDETRKWPTSVAHKHMPSRSTIYLWCWICWLNMTAAQEVIYGTFNLHIYECTLVDYLFPPSQLRNRKKTVQRLSECRLKRVHSKHCSSESTITYSCRIFLEI